MDQRTLIGFKNAWKVFLWRQTKEKLFNWKKNLFLSFLPIFIVVLVLITNQQLDRIETKIVGSEICEPDTERKLFDVDFSNKTVYLHPKNTITEIIGFNIEKSLELKDGAVRFLDNSTQLHRILQANEQCIIVDFHIKINATQLPKNITYELRVCSDSMDYKTDQYLEAVQDSYFRPDSSVFPYRTSGFLAMEMAIDTELVRLLQRDIGKDYKISFAKLPRSASQLPVKRQFNAAKLPIVLMIMVLYLYLVILPSIETKTTGFDEHIKTVTCYSSLNGIVNYIINLVQILLIIGLLFGVFSVYGLLGCTNIWYPLLLTVLFVICMMSFSFFLQAMFESTTAATIGVPLICLLPVFVFQPVINGWEICFPINALLLGIDLFQRYLNTEHCFGQDDIFRKTHPNGPYTYGFLCMTLFISLVVYLLLAWFVRRFFPGKYETAIHVAELFDRNVSVKEEAVEMTDRGDDATPVVRIQNLCKTFKHLLRPPVTVVHNFTLDMYRNQITVLLGQNEAAKTTILRMLTGLMTSTSGTIVVDGHSDVNAYRNLIGCCSQQTSFIPYLTCLGHLLLHGQLRGLSNVQARKQAKVILEDFDLTKHADELAHSLPTGAQRRMSLASAVIGGTKLIVLDEPSSGLDTESRSELWNMLLRLKKTMSILITTNCAEEAEALGNKIAIMGNDEVVAYGTSVALKQEHIGGYTLKLEKLDMNSNSMEKVLALIHKLIPGAKVKDNSVSLLSVLLPYENKKDFAEVMNKLQEKQIELCIKSISIADSSLEQVALNIAAADRKGPEVQNSIGNEILINVLTDSASKPVMWQQFLAIQYKNSVYWRRNSIWILTLFLVPAICLVLLYNMCSGTDQPTITNISMAKLLSPQVLFVAGASRDSPEMRRVTEFFKQNVKLDGGTFIEIQNKDLKEELLNISRIDKYRYNENLVAAFKVSLIDVSHMNVEVFFSGNIVHSEPIALNLVMNVITQYFSGENHMINVINHPARLQNLKFAKTFFVLSTIVFVSFLFLFIPLRCHETTTKFKQIQNVSADVYWLANFVSDVFLYLIYCLNIFILAILFDYGKFLTLSEYAQLLPVFIAFGCAYLLYIYVASLVFPTVQRSFIFFTSMLLTTMTVNLLIPESGLACFLSFFLPDLTLQQQLLHFSNRIDNNSFVWFYSFSLVQIILGICGLFVCENKYLHHLLNWFRRSNNCAKITDGIEIGSSEMFTTHHQDEESVERERLLVKSIVNKDIPYNASYSVVVEDLKKASSAARGIDFTVKQGECFGLLGATGAGKTTTLDMLALCEIMARESVIELNSISRTAQIPYKSQFGYCPQMDALSPVLTVQETLKYFAWLRGVQQPNTIEYWLKHADLTKFRDWRVQDLTPGNRKLLSVALAMVNSPSLVLLDEPTTGLDAKSRHTVWKCIKGFQRANKTVLIASNSMAECEHLCDRLAVMVHGQFGFIGGMQQLRNSYGKGFMLTLKLNTMTQHDLGSLKLMVSKIFNGTLKSEYEGRLAYFIADAQAEWSGVFAKITSLQKSFGNSFKDYFISELGWKEIVGRMPE